MNSRLLNLLAQAGTTLPEDDEEANTIQVVARKPVEAVREEVVPRSISNRGYLEEAQDAAVKAPERQGLFKTRGTLRDVLGLVGDAFLVQSGRAPEYGPQRMREKTSDALVGFEKDPEAGLDRVANVNPELFSDLYKQQQLTKTREAQEAGKEAARASKDFFQLERRKSDFAVYAGRLLGGAKSPSQLAAVKRVLLNRAKASGIDLDDLGLSDELTIEDAELLSGADMTVNQQRNLPIAQQNADSRRISATKPRAERAPPRPVKRTIGEVDADVADAVLSGKATPAQQKYYSERLKRAGEGKKRTLPKLPPGF